VSGAEPGVETSGELWLWLVAFGLPMVVGILLRYSWVALATGFAVVAWAGYKRLWARRIPRWIAVVIWGFGLLCLFRAAFDIPALVSGLRSAHVAKADESALTRRIAEWRDRIVNAQKVADRGDPDGARKLIDDLQVQITNEEARVGVPALPSFVAINGDLQTLKRRLPDSAGLVDSEIAEGRALARQQSWLAAEAQYEAATVRLREIEMAPPSAKLYLPRDFDLAMKRDEVAGLQEAAAVPAAYERTCGPSPTVDPAHGDVAGLKAFIQRRAHDPDSIEVMNCTKPAWSTDSCWIFRCNVRGKNAFGAKVLRTEEYSRTAAGFHESMRNPENWALEIEGPPPP
jgi:hypothetical protein